VIVPRGGFSIFKDTEDGNGKLLDLEWLESWKDALRESLKDEGRAFGTSVGAT